MKLSTERFAQAQQFIRENARDLDVRLFEYEFGEGTAVSVLNALTAYQNEDGGFGNAIEPDFRLPDSSPMATSVGLQYCIAVDAPAEHPVVQKAIRYLLQTYDTAHEYWPSFMDTAVNDYPHAPWWHRDAIVPPDEAAWPNVSAELVGYIHHYRELVPNDFYRHIMERARRNLVSTETLAWFYDCLCWERTANLVEEPFKSQIRVKITKTYDAMRPLSAESLRELPVFAIASGPESCFVQTFPEETAVFLQQTINKQEVDGSWQPGWAWGQYEDTWPSAQREWAGKITLEALHAYKNFQLL